MRSFGLAAATALITRRHDGDPGAAGAETAEGFGQRMLDVMCHAARTDGEITPEKVALIAWAGQKLAGTAFTARQIRMAAAGAATGLGFPAFRAFGAGLDAAQRETLMRGALTITVPGGTLTRGEQSFLARLAVTLGLSAGQVQVMLRSL